MIKLKQREPAVAIIILNWNRLDDTIECIESLKRITYTNHEVIVVDNGSEGNDAEVLRQRFGDNIHLIENSVNTGFAEGNNIGMRYALSEYNPDYFLLLNNDTVVDPDFLSEQVKVADSDPTIGIVGPKVYFHQEPDRIQHAGARINWWTGTTSLIGCSQIDNGQFDEIKEVDWVIGCSLLIRHSVIKKIGLLYVGYFAYFEETEWCAKCRKAGYKVVYAPRAKLWHKRQLGKNTTDVYSLYYVTRNRFLFVKRNATKLQFLCSLAYFFLWIFPLTTYQLFIFKKNTNLIKTFFRATRNGISLMLGINEPRYFGQIESGPNERKSSSV